MQHIAYVGIDRQIHECFFFIGGDGVWHHGVPGPGPRADLTEAAALLSSAGARPAPPGGA